MRCFRLLTAIAVLACSSLTWAEDNLPPVPKKTIAVLKKTPTSVTTEIEATAIIVKKNQDAPMPTVSGQVEAAPLPPTPADPATQNRSTCEMKCCCRQPIRPFRFLVNELLRKPIYGIEKAMNDAEGRCIHCEERRLNRDSEWIAREAARLEVNGEETCPHDLHAKLKLLKEERELANDVNRNMVKRAKLECKQAEYCQQKAHLQEKHDELYPVRN